MIETLRRIYYTKKGFVYDHSKRMWYKTRSDCCDYTYHQEKILYGKYITDDEFKKLPIETKSKFRKGNVCFLPHCDKCGQLCKLNFKYKV